MKIRLLTLFLCYSFFLQGQVLINGYVKDSLENPIVTQVNIQQIDIPPINWDSTITEPPHRNIRPFYYSAQVDYMGAFHLVIDTTLALKLQINGWGYFPKTILLDTLPTEPIVITLQRDSSKNFYPYYPYKRKRKRKPRPTELSMGLDFMEKDFDNFSSILGENNVKQLGNLPIALTFDFAKNYGRFYTGVNFGFSFNNKKIGDTLNIEANQTLYGFQFGYKLIDRKKILIMPLVSTKLYRFRLITGRADGKIPLLNYLGNQDIDLRFLQPVADFGLTIGYKHVPKGATGDAYVIWGLHGGYPIKLRKNPRVNGLRSRVRTDQEIKIGDFSLGIFLRAYFRG